MTRRCLLLFIGVLFFAITASAQEKQPEEKNPMSLDEIVVTATRTETEASTAPASTSVVTQQDIQQRTVLAPDEAVDTLPGVFDTRGKGITDTQASINLRGMPGQQRTLILLDGMPLNSAYDGSVQFGGLNPEDISRMEVVRGPFSSLYGGNAMGGVVNIITKMPEKEEVTITGGAGSDGYYRAYTSVGDKYANKLSLFFSTGYQTTQGYPTYFNEQSYPPPPGITGGYQTRGSGNTYGIPSGAPAYIVGDAGRNTWWDYGITAKAAYDVTPTSHLSFAYYRTTYGYGYAAPSSYLYNSAGANVWSYGDGIEQPLFGDWGSLSTDTYKAGYEGEIGETKLKTYLGMTKQGTNWFSDPGYGASVGGGPGNLYSFPNTSYFGDIQATRPLGDRNILTVGGSYKYQSLDSTEWNTTDWRDEYSKQSIANQVGGKATTYALFAQDEIQILKPLKAYIGAREDWWNDFSGYANLTGLPGDTTHYPSQTSSYFSPKGALVYTPFDGTVLRGSVGQAFRPPTLFDLYGSSSFFGISLNSNPYLKPETTTSWEIGGDQKLWKGGVFKATFFESYVHDMIYQYNPNPVTFNSVNVGEANIKGVELGLEQKFDKWLRLFANYTHNDATLVRDAANPAAVGCQLAQVPANMFNLGGDFTYKSFSGSLIGRYVGKRYNQDNNSDRTSGVFGSYDPYFTADAKLSYQITSFASVSFAVRNILDKTYYVYYQAPGRQWFSTLTIRF
jgi:iron complex outermembrane receptor protein